MSWRFSSVLALGVLATACAAAVQGRMVPVIDLKTVSGEWKGTISGVVGGRVPYSLLIHADGNWAGDSPNGSTEGTMRIADGVIQFRSQTTGRTGTYTLYEEGGTSVLRMRGDGGVSAELRRP